jgi:hypothetical protein
MLPIAVNISHSEALHQAAKRLAEPYEVNMSSNASDLHGRLTELRTYLDTCGERGWVAIIDKAVEDSISEASLARKVRSWNGGMGSLNDVYLCPHNGHKVSDGEVSATNERLGQLATALYAAADEALSD